MIASQHLVSLNMGVPIMEAGYGLFGWVVFLLITATMAVIALFTIPRPWESTFVIAIALIAVTYGGLLLFFLLYFLGYIPD